MGHQRGLEQHSTNHDGDAGHQGIVLVAALPSSAATGAAAASPPPPNDMGLLAARLGRLEAAVREQARETREARADARALERRVADLEEERRGDRDFASGEGGVSWRATRASIVLQLNLQYNRN